MIKKTKNTVRSTVRVGVNLPIPVYRLAKLVYEMQGLSFDAQIKELIVKDVNQMTSSGWFTGEMKAQLEENFPFLTVNVAQKNKKVGDDDFGSD